MTPADLSGEEQVRRTLEDLMVAAGRGDPEGVSASDMARTLGVSKQHALRIVSADFPRVNLRAGQVKRLPTKARRAILAVLEDAAGEPPRAPESRARQCVCLVGRISETLDRALMAAPHLGDDAKRSLRLQYAELAAAARAGARDLAATGTE